MYEPVGEYVCKSGRYAHSRVWRKRKYGRYVHRLGRYSRSIPYIYTQLREILPQYLIYMYATFFYTPAAPCVYVRNCSN